MLLKGRKTRILIDKFFSAESRQDESRLIAELKDLGRPALQKSIEALRQKRRDPRKAELLLESLATDDCAEDMVGLLSIPDPELVKLARTIIPKRLKKSAVPLLAALLDGADLRTRNNAVDLLCSLQDQASIPPLVAAYDSGGEALKGSVLKILGRIGGEASIRKIISALDDESIQVNLAAVRIMKSLKDPVFVEPLARKLETREARLRREVIGALGEIGDSRASSRMLAQLRHDDMRVRQEAVDAVIKMADASIVPEVVKLLSDEDVNVKRCAVAVLNKIKDPKAGQALIQAIKDADWWVRQIATDTLAELKGEVVIQSFVGLAREKDVNLRRCVVEFFNQVPDPSAFSALVGLLKDEDWWVRDKAAVALGRLKDPRAVGPLVALLDDEETKGTIPSVLAEIGGEPVLEPLRKCLFENQKRVRLAAIKAFGTLKARDGVSDLKKCLRDPDEEVRNEAAAALKEITGEVFMPQAPDPTATLTRQGDRPWSDQPQNEAIVVLDLCGSTDISDKFGDEFAFNQLKVLDQVVTPIAQRENCRFRKGTGDGYLMTFSSVTDSVRFAKAVLEDLEKHNKTVEPVSRINVRFAVNYGETRADESGDIHGMAVNMSFRVEGLKPEELIPIAGSLPQDEIPQFNRILLTENAVKEDLNVRGAKARLIGLSELKGLTGLHRIFMLDSARAEPQPGQAGTRTNTPRRADAPGD